MPIVLSNIYLKYQKKFNIGCQHMVCNVVYF